MGGGCSIDCVNFLVNILMINICLDININLGLCRLFLNKVFKFWMHMTKRSILVRFCHNNWELESYFVKICHAKKAWRGRRAWGLTGWCVYVTWPNVQTKEFCVRLLALTPSFPTLFHLLATASYLYHGWNILSARVRGGHFHAYKNDGGTRRTF